MKILLINPPISHVIDPSLPEVLLSDEDPMPPLGLMYLAGYLKRESNYDVQILDCQVEKINLEQIKDYVEKENPEVVGITTMTFTLLDVLETIKTVKSIKPNAKIVLGGPHPHIFPEETINLPGVDFCVLGEGEKAFKELIDNLDNPKEWQNISNLVFKNDGNIVNVGIRDLIQNLDELPFPARELTPYKKYSSSMATKFPVTTMFTSRGCPYKCLFCDRPHLGKNFRARSAKSVVSELEECVKLGIKEIFIYDDTFAVDRQRVLDICKLIKEKKIDISWDIRTRVNTVDEEILAILKDAGCQRIHFGVEAGTEKILKVLRKGITLDMAKKAFKLARKAGIQTLGYFMMGSPTETKEDILKTIKIAKKMQPDYAHFTITTPYPATELYLMGLDQGIIKNDYWKEFAKNPTCDFEAQVWEENLTKEELVKMLQRAYRSFYFRPNYILRRLLKIKSFKELITKSIMALKLLKV
ncbi:MAG TPA: radical SAM protein [bacterium]|nr:radical SAM protein [bacterium]